MYTCVFRKSLYYWLRKVWVRGCEKRKSQEDAMCYSLSSFEKGELVSQMGNITPKQEFA